MRVVLGDHTERIGAFQTLHRFRHRLEEIRFFVQAAVDEMRDDFGVGARLEAVVARFEFVAQFFVVLDDAVVNQADAATGEMRMGVLHGRRAVGGPTRVGDAGGAVDRCVVQVLREFGDAANGAAAGDFRGAVGGDGDAGRIVAAVFEPLQALDQNGRNVAPGHCAHDAAHRR